MLVLFEAVRGKEISPIMINLEEAVLLVRADVLLSSCRSSLRVANT